MIFNSITKVVYIYLSYANTLALHEILHALYENNVAVSRLSLFKEREREVTWDPKLFFGCKWDPKLEN